MPAQELPRARRMIRSHELQPLTGLGPTQTAELIRRGQFPKPVRVGARAKAWFEDDIAAWQEDKKKQAATERQKIERGEIKPQAAPKKHKRSAS